MARKEFPDYNRYVDIEELLADKYQNWNRGIIQKVGDYFKTLFMRFKRLIGYSDANIRNMDDLFTRSKYGLMDYKRANGDNRTRLMKEIGRKYGSVDAYLKASDFLIREFRDLRRDGINGIHSTHSEIKDEILRRIRSERDGELGEYNRLKFNKDPESSELADEHRKYIDMYNNILGENDKGNPVGYYELVKDIFPGIKDFKGGVFQSTLTDDLKADILADRDHPTGQKFIENDRHNTELDVSDEVKEFLSYIDDANGNLMSWRYAYVKMLSMFDGLALEQGNVLEQIRESFRSKELSGNEKALLDHVSNLWETLESDLTSKNTEVDKRYKYLDRDTFIMGDDPVDKIKSVNDARIRNEEVKVIKRKSGESSVDFADRIIEESKKPRDIKSFSIEKGELDKMDFKDEDISKAKNRCLNKPGGFYLR
jgi:hypothetical protein